MIVNASTVLHRAEREAKDNPWPTRMARIGILARGAIHLIVGWLAIRIATGDPSQRADQKGALAAVVRQPMGRILVLFLAAGFLAYAAWRLLEAVLDPEDKGAVQRLGYAARAVLYLGLVATAVSLALDGSSGSTGGNGSGGSSRKAAADVLGLPFGQALVVAGGLVVIGTGVWNGYRALSRSFEKKLKEAEMSSTERTWTIRAGFVGHLARMVAYGVVGGFLIQVALSYDPRRPVGLDESLHALAGRSYGPWLLALVGAGLIAFGLYQVMLARFREILDQ